jgi:DNA polymerase-3 subunit epsilon
MYAIVDIETTGSHAHNNGITEIAVILHNGREIEGRFESLVNPHFPIPRYVAALTGISNQMVAVAPDFSDIAYNVYNLLKGRIFIAHNVNFDYSFIKHYLLQAGYEWHAQKICTLRLSRHAFPGLRKYGLEFLCQEFNILNDKRHRAGGDAEATTVLFEMILNKGGEKLLKDFLKKEGREQILPPNLPKEHVQQLPYVPGVYYFHDEKGKVIYVGKAKCLKQRVVSHFTGTDTGKKRQEFLRNIHAVTYKECPTEFTAAILESIEIKRLWPIYNYSQKRFEQFYGIYVFEDSKGYLRLAIDRKRKHLKPIIIFSVLSEGYRILWNMVNMFHLNPCLCYLNKNPHDFAKENVEDYNQKVRSALMFMQTQNETYFIKEEERNIASYVLVEEGKFYGMGTLHTDTDHTQLDNLKDHLTAYPENEIIRSMIRSYAERNPSKVYKFSSASDEQ